MKLFDSELKIMEVLWEQGPKSAKEIVDVLSDRIGWNKNTTYAVNKIEYAPNLVVRGSTGRRRKGA